VVKINSTSGLADISLSYFHQKRYPVGWFTTSPGTLILVAGLVKICGGLRSVKRSTRFVWQTHFIICPMLLMHWAD